MKRMILVLFSVAVMAFACDDGDGGDDDGGGGGGGGDTPADMCGGLCGTGQYCWNGACLNGCTSDENCATDQYCVIDDEFFNEGRCHDKVVPGCQSDNDCEGNQQCKNGVCTTKPTQPAQACEWKPDFTDGCPEAQVCYMAEEEGGTNECYSMPLCGENGACPTEFGGSVCNVKADGTKILPTKTAICLMGVCLTDDNCPGEEKCEDLGGPLGFCDMGMIDTGCETDDDCDTGKVCEMGMCVLDFDDGSCETDDDCLEDEICEFGFCVPNFDF